MSTIENVSIDLGNGKELQIETGKMALLCNGAVTVRQGDTMVLVCATSANPRPGIDFFPLQVEYRERFAAAGKIPGGFFKREGRPTEKEILTARMTDRPLRPLFPEGFINEVQIVSTLLSADGENESDVLSILGASVALMVSDIPFNGPVGAVRVGRVNGEFLPNPTHQEILQSDIDLVYAGIAGKVIMIEGRSSEISEEDLRDAMLFADKIVQKQIEAQKELAARVNKEKFAFVPNLPPADFLKACAEFCGDRLQLACAAGTKLERQNQQDQLFAEMVKTLTPKFKVEDGTVPDFKLVWEILLEKAIRSLVLEKGVRQDGRQLDELRSISCEVGILPRVHGSALFQRGDTQALVVTTLGSSDDAQEFDVVTGGEKREFLTDILGSEDHYGDMDFKVAGTSKGITGYQLDLKIAGIDIEGMYQAMLLNRAAREKIRAIMNACLDRSRPQLSQYAPQMGVVRINPEKIGALIGPGGKNIRGIQDQTGARISVEEDGTVKIFTPDGKAMEKARYLVEACTGEVEVGKIYQGVVKTVKEFGAFVEILPGQEGMVHISELADYRVKAVEEICKAGDEITVKVIGIDDRGRVRLSRKAALAEL